MRALRTYSAALTGALLLAGLLVSTGPRPAAAVAAAAVEASGLGADLPATPAAPAAMAPGTQPGDGDVPRDARSAFDYYRQIADEYAEISPRSAIVGYVSKAFVALGDYYHMGAPDIGVPRDPEKALAFYRHAASYFGDPQAQYKLARLYLDGEGVARNPQFALSWLYTAAKKQHSASQALLGDLLWRGVGGKHLPARGLALISLALENARTGHGSAGYVGERDHDWIAALQARLYAQSTAEQRLEAGKYLAQWHATMAGPRTQQSRAPDAAGVVHGGAGEGHTVPVEPQVKPAAQDTGQSRAGVQGLPVVQTSSPVQPVGPTN